MRRDDFIEPGCGQLEITPNGVMYEWWLASRNGAGFHLWRMSDQSEADIREAAYHIRGSRDVVCLSWGWLHPAAYIRDGRLRLPASARNMRRVRGGWVRKESQLC